MAKWGITYRGSKSKIAEKLLAALPNGERFVDLFGGGFAMSHAALASNKYQSVLYNDTDPLIVQLILEALRGDYDYSKFTPEFIDRETFFHLRDTSGYVKYVWSFGGNGKDYSFARDKEWLKRQYFEYAISGGPERITARRRTLRQLGRIHGIRIDVEPIERIERLQALARVNSSELIITCKDYRAFVHRPGDIVYCDIPYEGTAPYPGAENFSAADFYDWVTTRHYPVYFSSFEINDPRFTVVAKFPRRSLMAKGGRDNKQVTEYLYKKGTYGGEVR